MTEQAKQEYSPKDLSVAFFCDNKTINFNGYIARKSDGGEVRSNKGTLLMTGNIKVNNEKTRCNFWVNQETGLVVAKAVEPTKVEVDGKQYTNYNEIKDVPPIAYLQVPAGVTADNRLFVRGSFADSIGEQPKTILKTVEGREIPAAGAITSGNEADKINTMKAFEVVIAKCMADPVAFKASLRKDGNAAPATEGQSAPAQSQSAPAQPAPAQSAPPQAASEPSEEFDFDI